MKRERDDKLEAVQLQSSELDQATGFDDVSRHVVLQASVAVAVVTMAAGRIEVTLA